MAQGEGTGRVLENERGRGPARALFPPVALVPVGRADTALDRVWHRARGASRVLRRRLLVAELLIVLAVFPLPYALSAVTLLIVRIQLGYALPWSSGIVSAVHGQWLWAVLEGGAWLTELAGAALVWYLLTRSGEGLAGIGLGGRKLRLDLALVLPVFLVVFFIPQEFGSYLLGWLHLQRYYLYVSTQLDGPAAVTAVQVTSGAVSGILEEFVVLGYLIRRLEQLGLRTPALVVIAVAVRVSYHLYYGWGAVPIALWAIVSVLVYLRIRRLLPFILSHFIWDAAIPVHAFYPTAFWVLLVAALLASAVCTARWATRPAGTAAGEPVP